MLRIAGNASSVQPTAWRSSEVQTVWLRMIIFGSKRFNFHERRNCKFLNFWLPRLFGPCCKTLGYPKAGNLWSSLVLNDFIDFLGIPIGSPSISSILCWTTYHNNIINNNSCWHYHCHCQWQIELMITRSKGFSDCPFENLFARIAVLGISQWHCRSTAANLG